MSYREDNVKPMFRTSSQESQTVPNDDRQDNPRGPNEPWFRQDKVWALAGLAVMVVGIAVSALTGQTGLFSFMIFGLVVLLVLAYLVTRSIARAGRGWKRLNDHA